jgi:hypothetical protein
VPDVRFGAQLRTIPFTSGKNHKPKRASLSCASDRSTELIDTISIAAVYEAAIGIHDHGSHATIAGKRQSLDHLVVCDDLIRARRQQAIDALQAEWMLEVNRLSARSCGHDPLRLFRYNGNVVSL